MPVLSVVVVRGSSEAHALSLSAHVPLLGLLRPRRVPVSILEVRGGAGQVNFPIDGFKQNFLGGKTHYGVEIVNCGLYAWKFIDDVDCFLSQGLSTPMVLM